MTRPFQVGITSDFKVEAPGRIEPILQEMLAPLPHIDYRFFDATGKDTHGVYATPDDIAEFDAILDLAIRFTEASFTGNDRLAVIARWGVGYDMIDVPACTNNDVLLAITVDAVRRPVAEAIVTLLLALTKKLPAKDQIVRTGRWDLRSETSGLGLRGKTLGSVGLGNIAGEMFRLLEPFGLGRKLAADPYARPESAATLGVELVELKTLFRESDFVAVNCFLSEETHGMINADLFALMKPTAYLINTARGPIVNQADLTAALQAGSLAGAGLDVFEEEPIATGHPLVQMDNVILSPHALAWTDELYQDNGTEACQSILHILQGQLPPNVVNRDVIDRSGFQSKLTKLQERT
ncbi:dehydrogenase [Chloroflexi bacterium TSY]|nr:dehydrogenase [Chloroflexi bacterium TSY]